MTAIRTREEHRTVLDFSNGKYSKNRIKQALRQCNIKWIEEGEDSNDCIIFVNEIKVGMYSIVLHFPFDSSCKWNKLKEYRDFEISIHENNSSKMIPLGRDPRFKNQYWVSQNFFGKLRMKHLVDVINHCQRLDRLKAFL